MRSSLASRAAAAVLVSAWATALLVPAVSLSATRAVTGAGALKMSVLEALRRLPNGGEDTLLALLGLAAATGNGLVLLAGWRLASSRWPVVRPMWRGLAVGVVMAALGCGALAIASPLTLRWGYALWLCCVGGAAASFWLGQRAGVNAVR